MLDRGISLREQPLHAQPIVAEPAPGKRRMHFTTNIVIAVGANDGGVTSNFLVVRDSEAGPIIAAAGTYRDDVVRTETGWKFKSRLLSHDISGDSGLNVK